MKILALNGSSRDNGNTEYMVASLLEGIEASFVDLRKYTINPIIDKRHDPEGFRPVDDDYDAVISQVLDQDILIFATPLYWYGMSGHMKNFVDRWSQSLRDPRYDFRKIMSEKKALSLIVGGDRVYQKALPLVQQFALIYDFMGIENLGYVIGSGSKPQTVQADGRVAGDLRFWNEYLKKQTI
ncbi:flavodoxin family protein [Thermoactinomyces sp. DSM 45892]|uniref:flavodoxin family protein n=1 Tax=Thermoactinomyces sp. DSM 45892 TaxID=1882753 RepID=UPI000898138A|nr:flavodoxin family protein [Thermoactinomyces sp. DSM 45892]SDY53084.1 Multimeric flavodoxin WrbA [Thermoactinomyces sp. DSM 45892]